VKALNQAVKRNLGRFPDDVMFQLTDDEAWPTARIADNARPRLVTYATMRAVGGTTRW
jgi:hypothetical protein